MKDDSFYLEHIPQSIANIRACTRNMSKEEFSDSTLVQDAVIRNFEIIGEATKKISDEIKKANQDVPWKEMAGMRDKLIHDYIGVDIEVI